MDLRFWEWGLLAAAVYLSVLALVRLMRQRRDAILNDIQRQVAAERRRRLAAKKKARQAAGRRGLEVNRTKDKASEAA